MAQLPASRRTVLLTGGSGFVGRQAIAPLLRRRFVVKAVSRHPAQLRVEGVEWYQANLLDPKARRQLIADTRATHLLHLAWDVEPERFWTAPENVTWAAASFELLREFREHGGQRAVFVGSCAEYDWSRPGDAPRREDDPCRPANVYGEAKHKLAQDAAAFAFATGLSLAWARLFHMFGLYEYPKRLVPLVATALIAGREVPCTAGRQVRDFTDTRDVAACLAALLDADSVTGPINVASGRGVTVRKICQTIADLVECPPGLLRFGALPDREGDPASLVADTSRLRNEVGFVLPETLEDRLADTVARYRRSA